MHPTLRRFSIAHVAGLAPAFVLVSCAAERRSAFDAPAHPGVSFAEITRDAARGPSVDANAVEFVLPPAPAPTQDPDAFAAWCLSLSAGYTCVDSESGDASINDVDETDTGFAVAASYRPLRYLTVEIGYSDFGEEVYTDRTSPPAVFEGKVSTTGYSISAIGRYPVWRRVEALARVGAYVWETEDKGRDTQPGGGSYTEKDDGTDLTYGLGVEVPVVSQFSARLEWNHVDEIDFDNYWLSLIWSF